jgi:hypothetical protein
VRAGLPKLQLIRPLIEEAVTYRLTEWTGQRNFFVKKGFVSGPGDEGDRWVVEFFCVPSYGHETLARGNLSNGAGRGNGDLRPRRKRRAGGFLFFLSPFLWPSAEPATTNWLSRKAFLLLLSFSFAFPIYFIC